MVVLTYYYVMLIFLAGGKKIQRQGLTCNNLGLTQIPVWGAFGGGRGLSLLTCPPPPGSATDTTVDHTPGMSYHSSKACLEQLSPHFVPLSCFTVFMASIKFFEFYYGTNSTTDKSKNIFYKTLSTSYLFIDIKSLLKIKRLFRFQIITGSHDSTIRLWDLAAGKSLCTLTNHKKSGTLQIQSNNFNQPCPAVSYLLKDINQIKIISFRTQRTKKIVKVLILK